MVKPKKKPTTTQVANELAKIVIRRLRKLPEEEQDRRILAAERRLGIHSRGAVA